MIVLNFFELLFFLVSSDVLVLLLLLVLWFSPLPDIVSVYFIERMNKKRGECDE